jgi:hypothetical protein
MYNIENGLLWGYSPISESTHPTEGDDSRRGSGNCNVLGGYTRRGRDIDRIGAGAVTTGQSDDAITRYGEGKSHV